MDEEKALWKSEEGFPGMISKKTFIKGLVGVLVIMLIFGNIMWTQMNRRITALEKKVESIHLVSENVKAMMAQAEESINAISATAKEMENTARILAELQKKVHSLEGGVDELRQDMEKVVSIAAEQGKAVKNALEIQKKTLTQLSEIVASQDELLSKTTK